MTHPSEELPPAALTYLIGRHTGVMTFMPIIPLLICASVWTVVRRRRRERSDLCDAAGADAERGADPLRGPDETDRSGPVPPDDPLTDLLIAALLSLLLYAAFYLVLFTTNYYGGGQSIGSRYFLQFSLVAALVPVAAGLSERVVIVLMPLAIVWCLVVLTPHFEQPDRAFVELWRTTAVQRLLPEDSTQTSALWG